MKKIGGVIIGPGGVGKGYGLGDILTEYFGVKIFISGDWCRQNAAENADRGIRVDDTIILGAASQHLHHHNCDRWHFDCPRSVHQAKAVLQMFHTANFDEVVVWHVYADESLCRQRIIDRAERQGRADDLDPVVIDRRMKTYYDPIVGIRATVVPFFADNCNRIINLDASGDLELLRDHVRERYAPSVFQPYDQHSSVRV